MPKARSPERDAAYRLWVESGGKKKSSDIAAELSIADNLVRKWKSADKWSMPQVQNAPKKRTKAKNECAPKDAPIKPAKRGAPYGNKNAVGNNGGAPLGSQNNFKHGAFERIIYDRLTDEEKEIFAESDYGDDVLKALKDELRLLNAKEYRLMRRMHEVQESAIQSGEGRRDLMLSAVKKTKMTSMSGLYDEEDGRYIKQEGTSFFDGNMVDSTETETQNMLGALLKIESELDKVTARKTKILAQIEAIEITRRRIQLEEERANGEGNENEIARAWTEAMTEDSDE